MSGVGSRAAFVLPAGPPVLVLGAWPVLGWVVDVTVVRQTGRAALLGVAVLTSGGSAAAQTATAEAPPPRDASAGEVHSLGVSVAPVYSLVEICEPGLDAACRRGRGYLSVNLSPRLRLSERWDFAPSLALGIEAGSRSTAQQAEVGDTQRTDRTSQFGAIVAAGHYHPYGGQLWLGPRALFVVRRAQVDTSGSIESSTSDYDLAGGLGAALGYDVLLGSEFSLSLAFSADYLAYPEGGEVAGQAQLEEGTWLGVEIGGLFTVF